MDTIDTLKEHKTGSKENKLVVLNPVTEKLSDLPEAWSPYSSNLQQHQSQEKQNSNPTDLKSSPIVSCYCCPTRECRRKNISFPFAEPASTSKDPTSLMSTFEKSLLSMYAADKAGFMNPLTQANSLFPSSSAYGEYDATSLASLACLQSSLMGGSAAANMLMSPVSHSSTTAASRASPSSPSLPGKSGLERMLESELLKQAKEKQSGPMLLGQGK